MELDIGFAMLTPHVAFFNNACIKFRSRYYITFNNIIILLQFFETEVTNIGLW